MCAGGAMFAVAANGEPGVASGPADETVRLVPAATAAVFLFVKALHGLQQFSATVVCMGYGEKIINKKEKSETDSSGLQTNGEPSDSDDTCRSHFQRERREAGGKDGRARHQKRRKEKSPQTEETGDIVFGPVLFSRSEPQKEENRHAQMVRGTRSCLRLTDSR